MPDYCEKCQFIRTRLDHSTYHLCINYIGRSDQERHVRNDPRPKLSFCVIFAEDELSSCQKQDENFAKDFPPILHDFVDANQKAFRKKRRLCNMNIFKEIVLIILRHGIIKLSLLLFILLCRWRHVKNISYLD